MIEIFATQNPTADTDALQTALNSITDYFVRARGTPWILNNRLTVPSNLPRKLEFDGIHAGGVVWEGSSPNVGFNFNMAHQSFRVELRNALFVVRGIYPSFITLTYPAMPSGQTHTGDGPIIENIECQGEDPLGHECKAWIELTNAWNFAGRRIWTRCREDFTDATGGRHMRLYGHCNGVGLYEAYGANGFRHIESWGESEGVIVDKGSMVGGQQGFVQYNPTSSYVPPGWTIRDYHTNTRELGIYLAKAAQIKIFNPNHYRQPGAPVTGWVGTKLDTTFAGSVISFAEVFAGHAFQDATMPTNAVGFKVGGTVVKVSANGERIHDLVHVTPNSSGKVHDCTGILITGSAVVNQSPGLVLEESNRKF